MTSRHRHVLTNASIAGGLRAWVGAIAVLSLAAPAPAQLLEELPAEMQGVGVDEKRGDSVPEGLRFRDEDGKPVTVGDLFDGDRPVLLSLNYSDCPMLCGLQLNGLVDALAKLKLNAGVDYTLVSVSVDPTESTVRAKQTEQLYVRRYNRAGGSTGFRFLTGNQKNIRALADAVGFRYKFVPEENEYSHSAVTIVCTPDGVVSRYLYGVAYDVPTLRLSMVEAADGKIGSPLDQLILFCFHYDETKGRYGPVARRLMSVGAGVTIFALAIGLLPYWLRRSPAPEVPVPGEPTPQDGGPAGGVTADEETRELTTVG